MFQKSVTVSGSKVKRFRKLSNLLLFYSADLN